MFMLPLMAASVLMQSYSIADGLILGNAISQESLGSVSTCSPILDVCTLIQLGLAGGCSIMVSHLFGAAKYRELSDLITEIRRLVILISLVIAVLAFVFAPQLIRLIHTPDDLAEGAVRYLRICFAGVPFTSLYSLQGGILRGMGDSKRPLGGIAVSSAVNIGLDMLFVVALGFGISGAAIATVAAEVLSAAYLWIRLEDKRRQYRSTPQDSDSMEKTEGPDKGSHVRECIELSAPQMIQSVVYSGGNVLLQNITNVLGAAVVIGVTVAFKVDSLLIIPLFSMGTAVSVFTGQNTGAAKPDRVRDSLRIGLCISIGISLLLSLVLWFYGYPIFTLFGLGEEAASVGFRYIQICLPFYWLFGVQFVLNGYLNGLKHTKVTAAGSVAGLAGRLALAYLGYRHFGADVLPAAEVLSWIICVCVDISALIHIRSKNARLS